MDHRRRQHRLGTQSVFGVEGSMRQFGTNVPLVFLKSSELGDRLSVPGSGPKQSEKPKPIP